MTKFDTPVVVPQLPWVQTPLVRSSALSKLAGCEVYLKLDLLQPSGSFKSRGVGNLILKSLSSNANRHIYSSSGGNAGLAAVSASVSLGTSCTVCVPTATSEFMKAKIRAAGAASVITHGASWVEADSMTRKLLKADPTGVYCSPFDHPDIWEGNSTIVDECVDQLGGEVPDVMIASVGGGGLFLGLAQGLRRHGGSGKTIVAVETEGAESLAESLKAGKLVTLPGISSIATSLGARTVAEKAFEEAQRSEVRSAVVSDAAAARACVRFADEERMLIEVACGASLAVLYETGLKNVVPELKPDSKVVVVVCGGK
ncbi:tryptophan synthase beta subunit-like PLP-dependent enzyme [Pyronema omphalodes]|nr:tryptophan synthase beta subunit-like PLP-dependent enzyme [Pyronema omphalodes]